jgi:hypothetical protein
MARSIRYWSTTSAWAIPAHRSVNVGTAERRDQTDEGLRSVLDPGRRQAGMPLVGATRHFLPLPVIEFPQFQLRRGMPVLTIRLSEEARISACQAASSYRRM